MIDALLRVDAVRAGAALPALLFLLAGCGGGGAAVSTSAATEPTRSASAELRWSGRVDRFAAALVVRLRQLERATGGGRDAGPIGPSPRPAVLAPGSRRKDFEAMLAALARCRVTLDRAVPAAPSSRLAPARNVLVQACSAFASATRLLGSAVRGARAPGDVDPDALAAARVRAREGVRLVAGALAIDDRVLGRGGRPSVGEQP